MYFAESSNQNTGQLSPPVTTRDRESPAGAARTPLACLTLLHALLPLQVAAGCDGLALGSYMHSCLAPRLRMPAQCLRGKRSPQERLLSRLRQRSSRTRKTLNRQMQSRRNVHTDAFVIWGVLTPGRNAGPQYSSCSSKSTCTAAGVANSQALPGKAQAGREVCA